MLKLKTQRLKFFILLFGIFSSILTHAEEAATAPVVPVDDDEVQVPASATAPAAAAPVQAPVVTAPVEPAAPAAPAGETPAETAHAPAETPPAHTAEAAAAEPEARDVASVSSTVDLFPRVKINTSLGFVVAAGAKANIGVQLGYAPWGDTGFYIGPEFSMIKSGDYTLLHLMGGFWKEIPVYGAPRLSVFLGAVGGAMIPQSPPTPMNPGLAAYLDLGIAQTVSKSMSVRAQFRPGMAGSLLAFMMNFDFTFHW